VAVARVAVADEIARNIPIRKGFNHLLPCPLGRGMLCDREVNHLSTRMLDHKEDEQNTHSKRGHGEEIRRHDLSHVVL